MGRLEKDFSVMKKRLSKVEIERDQAKGEVEKLNKKRDEHKKAQIELEDHVAQLGSALIELERAQEESERREKETKSECNRLRQEARKERVEFSQKLEETAFNIGEKLANAESEKGLARKEVDTLYQEFEMLKRGRE